MLLAGGTSIPTIAAAVEEQDEEYAHSETQSGHNCDGDGYVTDHTDLASEIDIDESEFRREFLKDRWRMLFDKYDPEGFGEIPLDDFLVALESQEWRDEVPANKRDILRVRVKESTVQAITFQDFVNVMSGKRSRSFKCAVHHRDREVCSENDFHLLVHEPPLFRRYLRCRNSTVCQGTAKIVNGAIQDLNPHSQYCRPDDLAETKSQFKEALKESLAHHWYRLRDLYDTLALAYPDAADHISYRSIRSYMKRCRKLHYPPAPRSIQEFFDRLADPQYGRNLEYHNGQLSIRLITDGSGSKHTLLYDENFVNTRMQRVTHLFIDGTFRSTPSIPDAYQLVTIMGIRSNHGIPLMWIIMSRKTQSAYLAVLGYIRDNVLPNHNIILVMSDFEAALRNAITHVFPTAVSTGCNTHHDRALYQKAKSLGLQNLIADDPDANFFFKKMLALAFLPANLIEGQYTVLKNELSANLRRRFSRFLAYYRNYWLQIVKPQGFSVYGLSRRTNNILESYNSKLGHKLDTHPSPWDFVCKLLKLQAAARSDVEQLSNGCQVGRHARYETIFKQKQLTNV